MNTPKVYALLVGIDAYPDPDHVLEGCVNDATAVRQFLENRMPAEQLEIEVLTNADATRMNIIHTWESHLTKAGEHDVAFFYFSGHGSQAPAHKAFWKQESDHRVETIVCVDSRLPGGYDLMDKEISALIGKVAEKDPHILVMMDCCNSGGGTRGAARVRSVADARVEASLDAMHIPTALKEEYAQGTIDEILIPEGRHVQLAAAQSFQLAKELELEGTSRGVFTYSLLEVLQNSNGRLSYNDIIRKVKTLVNKRTFDQDPQVYVSNQNDLNLSFLGAGNVLDKGEYYQLSHDGENWTIDGGQVHGIKSPKGYSSTAVTSLAVFEEGTPPLAMQFHRAMATAEVVDAGITKSKVEILRNSRAWLDPSQTYICRISDLPIDPLAIYLRGDDPEGLNMLEDALLNSPNKFYLVKSETRAAADYQLIANRNISRDIDNPVPGFIITRTSDRDDQPLVRQLEGLNYDNAKKAIRHLNHIARWDRIMELENPGSSLHAEDVRIQLLQSHEDELYPEGKEGIVLAYTKADDPNRLPRLRLRLVNTGDRKVFCSLLYLSSMFSIQGVYGDGGVWLNPGETSWAFRGRSIRGRIQPGVLATGKREVQETFKLIVSTEEFNNKSLHQQELEAPSLDLLAKGTTTRGKYKARSIMFSDEEDEKVDDWQATMISFKIRLEDEVDGE